MTSIPVREHTLDLIGNTPLVRLEGPSAEAGCDIYGKCEFTNPGASVKDRAALYIIRDAEARGELKAGGTVTNSAPNARMVCIFSCDWLSGITMIVR